MIDTYTSKNITFPSNSSPKSFDEKYGVQGNQMTENKQPELPTDVEQRWLKLTDDYWINVSPIKVRNFIASELTTQRNALIEKIESMEGTKLVQRKYTAKPFKDQLDSETTTILIDKAEALTKLREEHD